MSLLEGSVADAQMAGACMWLSAICQQRPHGCSRILMRRVLSHCDREWGGGLIRLVIAGMSLVEK